MTVTLSELCIKLRKHVPMLGIVNLNGQLVITTGYEYPKNAAESLRGSVFLGPTPHTEEVPSGT
jgi:hypothetical protein